MEYIDLRKIGRDGLKEIRRQVVRLKKMGKTGKEIEELLPLRNSVGKQGVAEKCKDLIFIR